LLILKNNYIGGDWVGGGAVNADVNPSDINDTIDEFATADAQQTSDAIEAARDAAAAWGTGSIQQRSEALDQIGNEILARRDELGTLLSREEGKVLAEGTKLHQNPLASSASSRLGTFRSRYPRGRSRRRSPSAIPSYSNQPVWFLQARTR
jgi:acyl-CoA reductase-like NAD-dependent aldehyde dehydrogenase